MEDESSLCSTFIFFRCLGGVLCMGPERGEGNSTVSLFFNTIFFTFVTMPLVKLLCRSPVFSASALDISRLQKALCTAWNVPSSVLKIVALDVPQQNSTESIYVDVRLSQRTKKDTRNFSHTHEVSHIYTKFLTYTRNFSHIYEISHIHTKFHMHTKPDTR